MPNGFFVTGTDTGIGKTVVAGALIMALRAKGINACGMKPVETGCKRINGTLIPSDGTFLKQIARMDDPIEHITPFCFETPAAPSVASEIEKGDIDIRLIKERFQNLQKKYQPVIVEGVGGLLVPIKNDYFVIDLVRELALPLIVVSRPSLGTINHTLLTVNYALKEGIKVAGIIINFSNRPENTAAEKTNPAVIRKLSPVPVIGTFPYLENLEDETIKKAALTNICAEIILRCN